VTATVVHRIEDGKIAEKWSDRDELSLLQQLGVVSLPEG
jgi:predicted ester cyclase